MNKPSHSFVPPQGWPLALASKPLADPLAGVPPPALTPPDAPLDVLVLEDSAFDAELLLEYLRVHIPGARCRLTDTEDGFIAALQQARPDLILSDFELPGFTGAQALQHARRMAPATPFIFVSGVIGEDNAVELLKQGATDYVSKGRMARLPLVVERALREVAERRSREAAVAALEAARDEAVRANAAKDRFLAMLSHELRTPLAPITTAAHLLERCAQVPPKYAHLLPMIRRNVALEARLIDDLLDLTAISAGKLSLHLDRVDLHALVKAVLDMVAEPLRAKGLHLELDLAATQTTLQADEARLQQVVWNILRNAIKFTPEGGRIQVATRSSGGRLTLTCTDTGIGIAQAALPRIFTAFEQADSEVAQRYGGLGLGLAIARGLVLKHGGNLVAASAGRGHGATFTLTLPLADAQGGLPAAAPQTPRADPAAPAAGRLLLIEDNADAAESLLLSLQSYGYEVTHAATRAAGLAAAGQAPFDAVITDLGLPDGSGIELGRLLGARLPVIALSGYGTPQDRRRSQGAGFTAHLVKPVDAEAVHQAVQQALDGHRA